MTPRSLYIHVPFCARRCLYCDFAVQATREPPTAEWAAAVGDELRLLAAERGWTEPLGLDTLYIGGGTPSLLGPAAMAELATRLRPHAGWDPARVEWTAEANPESFGPEITRAWRAAGVNRISLGVQTFHAPSLRWMGRLHGPDGPARAMEVARQAGFGNVSIDLIFGLPERLGRDWGEDLDRALSLEPEHVSLYGLTAEPGAALGRWVREGREAMVTDDRYADEYLLAHNRLVAAGFEHYEVSNFARPGRASRHNSVYWTGEPYAALGPSAHSYDPPVRRWNLRAWDAYRDAISEGRLPTDGEELIGEEDAALERVWLTLRTRSGLPLETATTAQRQMAREWERRGWAQISAGRVVLSPDGWLLLDRLALELAGADEPAGAATSSRQSGR